MTPEAVGVGTQILNALPAMLGGAAFGVSVWSNFIARQAVKNSGSHRVAEFRKEWIERLRADISEFLAYATQVTLHDVMQAEDMKYLEKLKVQTLVEDVKQRMLGRDRAKSTAIHELIARMQRLRVALNPEDSLQKEILRLLDEVFRATISSNDKFGENSQKLLDATRRFLKEEWKTRVVAEMTN